MKKIKHISDIREEKMRLRIRQLELEKEIRQNWKDLRHSFSPSGFIKETFTTENDAGEKQGFWSTALDYGVAFVGREVAARAGENAEKQVLESMGKLSGKLKSFFGRKKRRT